MPDDDTLTITEAITPFMSMTLREARRTFEREYLVAQLKRFDGNVPRTAEFMGIGRCALYQKLRKLDLNSRAWNSS